VFLTKVNDYQETKTNSSAVAGRGYLANVGTVDIPGFEAEIRQSITKSIRLLAGLGFTRARYNSYPEYPTLEGKAPGNRPDWNLHVGTEYTSGAMTYAATVFGTDSFNSAYTSAGATTRVDGHLIANLRATYAQKNYSVTAFINNVADEEYFLNAGYYNYGSDYTLPRGQVGSPRTIGVSVKADF
jgi:outer membrane receptor protein involved in Fe transport